MTLAALNPEAEHSAEAAFRPPATILARPAPLQELRQDIDKALSLIPGRHRLNLHALYADFSVEKPVPRNELTTAHFQSWIDWCKEREPRA